MPPACTVLLVPASVSPFDAMNAMGVSLTSGLRAGDGLSPSAGPPALLCLLVVLGQLHLVQGWDDLFPQQLHGAHDILMAHGPLIAVDVQIAGVQALDHLEQLPGHSLGIANNDVIDLLELLVAHADPQSARAYHIARGPLRFDAHGLTRLVTGRIVMLTR